MEMEREWGIIINPSSSDDELDVVVVDEVGEDLVGLLRGVVAVPEEVVGDGVADGGGDAVAEDGDLEEARAAASLGGLREAVPARVHHHVVEEAVDVHEDEQRAGVLRPERRQLRDHAGTLLVFMEIGRAHV